MEQIKELEIFNYFTDIFTDLQGTFSGRLSAVIPLRGNAVTGEATGTQSKFIVKIKTPYSREVMRQLEEGMLISIPNFKSNTIEAKLTLFEITEIKPEHFGLNGLSDSSFYPLQMEIIEQSEIDWQINDSSTMIIQVVAIPINYSLVITTDDSKKPEFRKGFEYPIPGSPVKILNEKIIDRMYNEKILKKNAWSTDAKDQWDDITDPRINPRIGRLNMFDSVPLYIDYDSLIRYHFGIFAFTGGGKSNLLSNLLRRILYHTENKIVIFDVSSEYPFLIADILADKNIKSKIILENSVQNVDQFYRGVVKPRQFEDDERFTDVFQKILDQGKVTNFSRTFGLVPTFQDIIDELDEMRKANMDKPHYINAIEEIFNAIVIYIQDQDISEKNFITNEFVDLLVVKSTRAMDKFNVHDKSGLYSWATSRSTLKQKITNQEQANNEKSKKKGASIKDIQNMLQGEERLLILSIADPNILRDIVIELTNNVLYQRKRDFTLRPYILFVFDEAQEFLPSYALAQQGNTKLASQRVEALLRQGRKYGLGCCIATQRIAYLNSNALQQLHTFFVGPLPRPYDRVVVSSTFLIDTAILEKTLEFAPGQFLLSSYVSSGIENVPILFTADNNEDQLEDLVKNVHLLN